jgi:NhaP-type Na+/H+ or K+/H+ antiporter
VNQGLYFLVFGESLFNDGVTVVLYNTMQSLLEIPTVGLGETLMAVLSFFLVAFGGALIGCLTGLFASYITKFTEHVSFNFFIIKNNWS